MSYAVCTACGLGAQEFGVFGCLYLFVELLRTFIVSYSICHKLALATRANLAKFALATRVSLTSDQANVICKKQGMRNSGAGVHGV